jgi:hypothetical protein
MKECIEQMTTKSRCNIQTEARNTKGAQNYDKLKNAGANHLLADSSPRSQPCIH